MNIVEKIEKSIQKKEGLAEAKVDRKLKDES